MMGGRTKNDFFLTNFTRATSPWPWPPKSYLLGGYQFGKGRNTMAIYGGGAE